MKTSDRLATIFFLLAAPAARFLELKNNYDPAGLPTGGFPYLPAVLAAAAVVFLLSARGLPARDAVTADFGGIFRFDGNHRTPGPLPPDGLLPGDQCDRTSAECHSA